jgi:hypothetical protein
MKFKYQVEGVSGDGDTNEEEFRAFAQCNELNMAMQIMDIYKKRYPQFSIWIVQYDAENDGWDSISLREVAGL